MLLVNLGAELTLSEPSEPLLAPPVGHTWVLDWSSEHARYGGSGTPDAETSEAWYVPGESAVVLRPAPVAGIGFHVSSTRKGQSAQKASRQSAADHR
jgi:hypothetical protein